MLVEETIDSRGALRHGYIHWRRPVEDRRFTAKVAGALVSEDSQRRGRYRAIAMLLTSTAMFLVLICTTNHGICRKNEMQ
jgi:hypothetical protein